jgi:hypothetical protein
MTLRVDIAIDKLDKLIRTQSDREARFEKEVQMRGGREKCLESEDKLVELLKIAEQREGRPQNKVYADAPTKDVSKPTSKTISANGSAVEHHRLDASLLYELRAPLRNLLDENRALFMFKLDTQTSDIKDAIKDSETRIMWAFNSRFRRVKDPVRIQKPNLMHHLTQLISSAPPIYLERDGMSLCRRDRSAYLSSLRNGQQVSKRYTSLQNSMIIT